MRSRSVYLSVLAAALSLPVETRAAEVVKARNPDPKRLPTLSVYNDETFSRGQVLTMVAATFPDVPDFTCDSWCYESAVDFLGADALASGQVTLRHRYRDAPQAVIVTTVTPEPGAVVCRIAPSFIRFGHFEILTARGDVELLRRLADFTIRSEYPELLAADEPADAATYAAWFAEVSRRTADMIVDWMRVGFVHGVMNTDNTSIAGETIDYGPCAFLDEYDPAKKFSSCRILWLFPVVGVPANPGMTVLPLAPAGIAASWVSPPTAAASRVRTDVVPTAKHAQLWVCHASHLPSGRCIRCRNECRDRHDGGRAGARLASSAGAVPGAEP